MTFINYLDCGIAAAYLMLVYYGYFGKHSSFRANGGVLAVYTAVWHDLITATVAKRRSVLLTMGITILLVNTVPFFMKLPVTGCVIVATYVWFAVVVGISYRRYRLIR